MGFNQSHLAGSKLHGLLFSTNIILFELMMLIKSKIGQIIVIYLIVQFVWWVKLHLIGGLDTNEAYLFNISYGFIGLIGGINGIFISTRFWDGTKSLVGKAILLLSCGLLFEWIASLIWGYYNIILAIEIPYPSIADVFFFGMIPFYAFAMINLAAASGIKISLQQYNAKVLAVIIPLIMLTISYLLFLTEGLDTSNPVRMFFDLAYPLGEAITLSIAILTYLLTKKYLGGMMKKIVKFVLLAYLVQFVADYWFLFKALQGTYYNGGMVDLLYAVALASMSIAILQFGEVVDKIGARKRVK